MNVDMYELKREHKNFQNALDLLYMLYVAAKAENLDMGKYPAALHVVWRHMCHIEERMNALLEPTDESDTNAGAAVNEE